MADLFCSDEFTPTEKLKAVEREVGFRRYVYPPRVAAGKMKQADADAQLAIMEAIAADYRAKDESLFVPVAASAIEAFLCSTGGAPYGSEELARAVWVALLGHGPKGN